MAAADQQRCRRRRRLLPRDDDGAADDADRISDLPDNLLHRVLICLPSTADAARTSVLSRRWRRVWTHLPELALRCRSSPDAAERVDAALAASSSTPVLRRLEIAFLPPPEPESQHVTAERVCSWLRFAAERLAGELRLSLPLREELVLPVCGRFTAIRLDHISVGILRLRFQLLGGVFTALAALTIKGGVRMEGRELEEVVSSSRCPSLKELVLDNIILEMSRDQDHVLCIRSKSLQKLRVDYPYVIGQLEHRRQLRLQVDTPELQELSLCLWSDVTDAHIAAPKLSKFCWHSSYDPRRRHKLVTLAARHLKRLELTSQSLALLGCFDAVDELDLLILLSQGEQEYTRVLEERNKIMCEALVVTFSCMFHAYHPILLHLLRKCFGIRKLVMRLGRRWPYRCKLSGCPCNLGHNRLITNDIVLDSLQEIVLEQGGGDANQIVKLVSLLCRCSETFQKKVHITVSSKGNKHNSSMRRKIDRLLAADPNDKVEVTIC